MTMMKLNVVRYSAIALLVGLSSGQAIAGVDAGRGMSLFKKTCSTCHAITKEKAFRVGPDLAGLSGRKAGTGQYTYSRSMKASGIVWNRKTLDTFLMSPNRAVPGTRMVISVPAPADRADIIAYLMAQR